MPHSVSCVQGYPARWQGQRASAGNLNLELHRLITGPPSLTLASALVTVMPMLRIAVDARALSIPEKASRGAGHVIRQLLRELAHGDPDIRYTVLMAPGQERPDAAGSLEWCVLPWKYGDLSRRDWWLESWRTGRAVSRMNVDLYHSTDLYVPRGYHGPILVTAYDYIPIPLLGPVTLFGTTYGWRWNVAFRWRYRWTWRALARRAARVATISHTTAEVIARHRPELRDKLVPIPLGLENEAFAYPNTERLPQGLDRLTGPVLLHVGGLEYRKNPRGVLETFARLRLDFPGATLLLVGPFHGVRPDAPGVLYLGYLPREELMAVYRRADLLLYPSFDEGFGLPVLEAIAAGCRVVTSRGTATEEVAAGRAVLVDPHDLAGIEAGVRASLDGRRPEPDTHVRRARDTAADYRSLYRTLISTS